MTDLQLLTIKDVQKITKLGRTKLYELMRDGELPYIRIGRSVRVRQSDLEEWITENEESVEGPGLVPWQWP